MISKKASELLLQFKNASFSNGACQLHLKDEHFEGAEFVLEIKGDKVVSVGGVNLDNNELHLLLCSCLFLIQKIGLKYLLIANFREIENFLRDNNSEAATATILSLSKKWQTTQGIFVKNIIYSLLLLNGVSFKSFAGLYENRIRILDEMIQKINNVLGTFELGQIEFIALEEKNVYLSHKISVQNSSATFSLNLLDGVGEYINFCLGSNTLKLVAQ